MQTSSPTVLTRPARTIAKAAILTALAITITATTPALANQETTWTTTSSTTLPANTDPTTTSAAHTKSTPAAAHTTATPTTEPTAAELADTGPSLTPWWVLTGIAATIVGAWLVRLVRPKRGDE